ncbi:MAG: hypothetical protein K5873_01195 [Treponema sp.]|nr:hypothetical protein [Treponema sp.]
MSKKTQQIYKALDALEDLQNQISIINQLAKSRGEEGEEARHLENIEFQLGQNLKALRFWINSLYAYNGKSTSRAKQNASKENGKKGGRPPKEITRMRKRRLELNNLLEEARSEKNLTTDFEKEEKLTQEISEYEKELIIIEEKLKKWEEGKKAAL